MRLSGPYSSPCFSAVGQLLGVQGQHLGLHRVTIAQEKEEEEEEREGLTAAHLKSAVGNLDDSI